MKLGRLLAIDPEADILDGMADLPSRRQFSGPQTVTIPVEPGTQTLTANVKVTWELLEQH